MRTLLILTVTRAIDLHSQPRRRTIEIEDVRPHRVLIAEDRRVGRAALQARPKHELRFSQGSSQSFRAL
jgi:hypothetical protein